MRRARSDLDLFDGRSRRRRRAPSRPRRRRNVGQLFMRLATAAVALVAVLGLWVLVSSLLGDDPVELRVESTIDGSPVVGAVITNEGGASATSDESGEASLGFKAPHRLSVSAPGYRPAQFEVNEIPRQAALTLRLEPYVLQGRVTDASGAGLVGAEIRAGDASTVSGEFGAFELTAVDPGPVEVWKSAWEPTEFEWSGTSGRVDIALEPFIVRAVRVHQRLAGPNGLADLLRLIEGTVVNALVFDTKIEDGAVVHDIDVPLAREVGAISGDYDARTAVETAHNHGLYAITRIVTFQDPIVAPQRPDLAITDAETGDIWRNNAGHSWLDPTNRDAWEYPLDLAVEACKLGFDEIQFDYVRFPSDGDISRARYSTGEMNGEQNAGRRVEAIAAFLAEARERVHAEGCAISADIFGIVMSSPTDQGIGQRVEELSWVTDVLSPMVYPSHYGSGWLGFDNPNNHPDAVVSQALNAGAPKLEGGAFVRPWLQAFSWNTEQTLESIRAAERAGVGWMLWNASSDYRREWLPTP